MTSSTTLDVLLVVISGVFIILVFANIGLTEEIDRETCHQSVIYRATLPDSLFFDLKDLPSLKCETAKFCITDKTFGKADCKDAFGEGDYVTVRVDEENLDDEINKFVARELASCWSMMGEGKIQVFTRDALTKKRCSVCSRIAFDKEMKDYLSDVEGLGNYLLTREVPNKNMSYWKFLAKGVNTDSYDEGLDFFSTEEKAIVFMEIGDSTLLSLFPSVAAALGGAKVGAVVGAFIPVPGTTFVGGIVGFVGGAVSGKKLGEEGEKLIDFKYHPGWSFVDYDSEDLKGLGCTSFENIP